MTTDQIVIVTGARILADDPAAVAWAREILTRELASATLVVAGDARGPDQWAHEIAQGMVAPIACERWCINGRIEKHTVHHAVRGEFFHAGCWADASTTRDPQRRPLARNAAMIAAYDPFRTHATVRLVALHHALATTNGTAHTVSLARKAGIDVTEYTWRAPS